MKCNFLLIRRIKGTSPVISSVFGADPKLAAIIGLLVVLIYSILGGLWASVTTSALSTLLHTVPSAIILVAALHYAGGVNEVWHSVASRGNGLLRVTRAIVAVVASSLAIVAYGLAPRFLYVGIALALASPIAVAYTFKRELDD